MSATTVNKYKISLILDLRSTQDDAQKVIDDIKQTLTTIGAETTEVEDLGTREFARAADRRFAQGHYVFMWVAGPSSVPIDLQEKLKHDKRVNRIFVEA